MGEIRQALAVGKEVITHTDSISVLGWSGAGYVIYDPEMGSGAWKIGGGMNGGFFAAFGITAFGLIVGALLFVSGSWLLGLFIFSWEFFNAVAWIGKIELAKSDEDFNEANFSQAVVGILGLIPFSVPESVIVQTFGVIWAWLLTSIL